MSNIPKISIIVPIYNAEKYLDRCMKSIYVQTFTDYEIILVNDGSTDRSSEICRRYQGQDSRITFIDKKNEGPGATRNAGMEAAHGDYLAFPDVDDWFEPEMYAELVEIASTGDYDVVFSGVNYYKQTADSGVAYSRSELCPKIEFLTKEDCRKNVMTFFPSTTIFDSPCNKLYKRSIVVNNHVRFPDIRRCQDAVFNIDFYNCISSAASSDKAFYNYMENTSADVQRKFPRDYIDINIFYFTHLISILKEWGVYRGDIKCHYDTSFVIAVYGTMEMFDNPKWGLDKNGRRDYVRKILNKPEVQQFLLTADIRQDAQKQASILKNRNERRFFFAYGAERLKDQMRKNNVLRKCYHLFKKVCSITN